MKKKILAIMLVVVIIAFSGCTFVKGNNLPLAPCFFFPTDGALASDEGRITFTTETEENIFNAVVLQLYYGEPMKHIMNLNSSKEGVQKGEYVHELETGSYIVRLQANSNKKDEAVNIKVYLVNGEQYSYSYNVREVNDKSAIVSDFKFGLK